MDLDLLLFFLLQQPCLLATVVGLGLILVLLVWIGFLVHHARSNHLDATERTLLALLLHQGGLTHNAKMDRMMARYAMDEVSNDFLHQVRRHTQNGR